MITFTLSILYIATAIMWGKFANLEQKRLYPTAKTTNNRIFMAGQYLFNVLLFPLCLYWAINKHSTHNKLTE